MIDKSKTRFQLVSILPAAGLFILFTVNSCSYNKAELLYPKNTCDTAAVTYSKTISPILFANCTGCHGGAIPADSIDLTIYSAVKQQVDNGKLWAVITHAPGFPAMPRNSDKLSDCVIEKIRVWILAGAPNN